MIKEINTVIELVMTLFMLSIFARQHFCSFWQ